MAEKRKSVLITGGCGFIGANLVTLLLERDYRVRVLDNLSVGRNENIPCHVVEYRFNENLWLVYRR